MPLQHLVLLREAIPRFPPGAYRHIASSKLCLRALELQSCVRPRATVAHRRLADVNYIAPSTTTTLSLELLA